MLDRVMAPKLEIVCFSIVLLSELKRQSYWKRASDSDVVVRVVDLSWNIMVTFNWPWKAGKSESLHAVEFLSKICQLLDGLKFRLPTKKGTLSQRWPWIGSIHGLEWVGLGIKFPDSAGLNRNKKISRFFLLQTFFLLPFLHLRVEYIQ